MQLTDLKDYIGSLLEVDRFRDNCPNGVQVEGRSKVLKIATGVTASQLLLDSATAWGADAIIVHHGYFWRGEDAVITGVKKRRIAHLLSHDVSLLAYHLPLDAHAELGNNAQLAKLMGWQEQGRFGEQDVACFGELIRAQTLGELADGLKQKLEREPLVMGDLADGVKKIAWCSGAAQGYFEQAIALGVDVFITGEISEQNVHLAQESGVAFISAGHHATERYGVMALGKHLADQFGLELHHFELNNPV
ncbi:MAG: Nif3-like dinuclear metal center hexameric protein [Gallionellaceae bacterium]